MRRATRRYRELAQAFDGSDREPITVGCWVVASSDLDDLSRPPLFLAEVAKGPDYMYVDGHATSEIWELSDRSVHRTEALTRLDVDGILAEGLSLVRELRSAGPNDDRDATAVRVHRAACLAREVDATRLKFERKQEILRLIVLDHEISDAEVSWRDLTARVIPTLIKNLHDAGALALARDPAWRNEPGENPHPRWRTN